MLELAPPAPREADSLTRIVDAIDADEWRTRAAPLVEPVLRRAIEDPDAHLADLATACPGLATDDLTDRPARILFVSDLRGRTSEVPVDAGREDVGTAPEPRATCANPGCLPTRPPIRRGVLRPRSRSGTIPRPSPSSPSVYRWPATRPGDAPGESPDDGFRPCATSLRLVARPL